MPPETTASGRRCRRRSETVESLPRQRNTLEWRGARSGQSSRPASVSLFFVYVCFIFLYIYFIFLYIIYFFCYIFFWRRVWIEKKIPALKSNFDLKTLKFLSSRPASVSVFFGEEFELNSLRLFGTWLRLEISDCVIHCRTSVIKNNSFSCGN